MQHKVKNGSLGKPFASVDKWSRYYLLCTHLGVIIIIIARLAWYLTNTAVRLVLETIRIVLHINMVARLAKCHYVFILSETYLEVLYPSGLLAMHIRMRTKKFLIRLFKKKNSQWLKEKLANVACIL